MVTEENAEKEYVREQARVLNHPILHRLAATYSVSCWNPWSQGPSCVMQAATHTGPLEALVNGCLRPSLSCAHGVTGVLAAEVRTQGADRGAPQAEPVRARRGAEGLPVRFLRHTDLDTKPALPHPYPYGRRGSVILLGALLTHGRQELRAEAERHAAEKAAICQREAAAEQAWQQGQRGRAPAADAAARPWTISALSVPEHATVQAYIMRCLLCRSHPWFATCSSQPCCVYSSVHLHQGQGAGHMHGPALALPRRCF